MKYKQISFYAFRDNKGATGGPGGVLYLQKNILGNTYNDIKLRYVFRTRNKIFRKFFKDFYFAAFIQVLIKELFRFKNYYICNDIGSAYALALLRKNYSLIYHQQGPIVEELINFGENISEKKRKRLKLIERVAFERAKTVHFPSKGAENMYFNSSFRSCSRDKVNIGDVLPNTVDVIPVNSAGHNNVLTFMSVGTMTMAKGQDQTIKFLEKLLDAYQKPIKYVVVGRGPLASDLLNEYDKLKLNNPLFDFTYYDSLSHDSILNLMQKADVYIMLHRISIFDMATLEAMASSCAIVLSNVGGNPDFNVEDNVLLVDCNNYALGVKKFLNLDIEKLKVKNKQMFIKHFSFGVFRKNMHKLIQFVTKAD